MTRLIAVIVFAFATFAIMPVSAGSPPTIWVGAGVGPEISGDGRFVAWVGNSGQNGLYVYDRDTGQTKTLAEMDANGGTLIKAAMSDDGRFIAFNKLGSVSIANADTGSVTDLGVSGEVCDISGDGGVVAYFAGTLHIRDLESGVAESIQESGCGQLNLDGTEVAYIATDPALGITDGTPQIAVKNLSSGDTELISRAPGGEPGNAYSSWPSISNDGRYVVFETRASNLLTDDPNDEPDVLLWDQESQTMEIVSPPGQGDFSQTPQLSSDGRHVVFVSLGTLMVRDLETGVLDLASVNSYGEAANAQVPAVVGAPQAISADGRYVAFESDATNLASGNLAQYGNIFLHDRDAPFVVPTPSPGALPPTGGPRGGSGHADWLGMAAVAVVALLCTLAAVAAARRSAR